MLIPAVLLIITVWATIAILQRIRRNAEIRVVYWAVLLIGLIGIDLWRILEGFTPALKDSSDLFLFVTCSFLVVVGPPLVLGIYKYVGSKQSSTQGGAAEPLETLRSNLAVRTAKAVLVVAIAFVLIVSYSGSLLLGAAYTYGISWLPKERNPTGQGIPALAVEAAWMAEFGSRPIVIERFSNYDVIRLYYQLLQPRRIPRVPSVIPRGFPTAYRAYHGAARILVRRDPLLSEATTLRGFLRQEVTTIWVGRNWTADQAVRTVLGESYLGNGCRGFEEASRGYFGCLPNQLTMDEIALLVGLLRSPTVDNPWRYPANARKRMKYVLSEAFSKNGSAPPEPDLELPSRLLSSPRWNTWENQPDIDYLKQAVRTYSYEGDLNKLQELLGKGIDLNEKDHWCRTALMYACRRGHLQIMELLLDKGADINAQNDFGWTPLMEASLWGRLAVVNVLMNRAADVNVKDNWGATALTLASSNGHTAVIKLLKDHGAKE
jgi:hypothetical protein